MTYEIHCAILGVDGAHDFGVLEDGLSLGEARYLLTNPPAEWVRDNTFLSIRESKIKRIVMFTKTNVDEDGPVNRVLVDNGGISSGAVEIKASRLSKEIYDKISYEAYFFMANRYVNPILFMPVIMKEFKSASSKIEEEGTRDLYRRLLRGENIYADVRKRFLNVMNVPYQDRTWDSNILSAMYRIANLAAKFRIDYLVEEISYAIYRNDNKNRERYLRRLMQKMKKEVPFVEFSYGFMTYTE